MILSFINIRTVPREMLKTSLRTLRMLMNGKSCLIPILYNNGWSPWKVIPMYMYEGYPRNNNVQLVKNLASYLYKMHRVFSSIHLEVNDSKSVEMIMFTLKIPAKVPLLVGLLGSLHMLTRCCAISILNSAEFLFSVIFPSKETTL